MPISKEGKLYYLEEQYKKARYESSALEYARSQGYDLVKKGKLHVMREHDSMVFTESGMWFWNSRDLKGGAIEFMTQYEHRPYVDAVLILAGEDISKHNISQPQRGAGPGRSLAETIANYGEARKGRAAEPPAAEDEKGLFALPERNNEHRRVFAYLTKSRGIDSEIVHTLLKRGKLYETKKYHNAAFVFQNAADEPVGAFLRSTNTEQDFRGMAKDSDRNAGYFYFGSKKATVACIFEAAIDAMSYATLQKESGNDGWANRYYVASGGTGDGNILAFLHDHPQVDTVILCQDNDKAGHTFAEALADKLRLMEYTVTRSVPQGKDFNDDLRAHRAAVQSGDTERARQIILEEQEAEMPEAAASGEFDLVLD